MDERTNNVNRNPGGTCRHSVGPGRLGATFGVTREGQAVSVDMGETPALLVTGTTGSGKSALVKTVAAELMSLHAPHELRLAVFDSSRVGYRCLTSIPYMFYPTARDPEEFERLAGIISTESERRLRLLARPGRADLEHLLVIIDDLAAAEPAAEALAALERSLQTARLTRMHFVFVTSTPSSHALTPALLSNIDLRVSFRVTSRAESRNVLGCPDASTLATPGEMIVREAGAYTRCRAAHLEDEVIWGISLEMSERYEGVVSPLFADLDSSRRASAQADRGPEEDPLLREAADIVVSTRLGSTAGLQRKLKIGYARAGRLMDELEMRGIVGPPSGSAPRDVLVDLLDEGWPSR